MTTRDDEQKFLSKLEALVEDKSYFTVEEAELLKRVAARERAWASIGALAGSVRTILTWLGFMLAAWAAFRAGLIAWLADALGTVK